MALLRRNTPEVPWETLSCHAELATLRDSVIDRRQAPPENLERAVLPMGRPGGHPVLTRKRSAVPSGRVMSDPHTQIAMIAQILNGQSK